MILLLDEYDAPMQEAYVNGYWKELADFIRSLFNSAFKTNPYLERAVMTGITRISKESIFSDLNNLEVITTTSEKYADAFGFTEPEVVNQKKPGLYWANTSSNRLVGKLLKEGDRKIKKSFERLLAGEHLITPIEV